MSATERDLLHEEVVLDHAMHRARLTVGSFPALVKRRLNEGQELYGDRWTTRTVDELLAEIEDEAIDAAAWGCLTSQALVRSGLDEGTVSAVGELLAEVAGHAASAQALLTAARKRAAGARRGSP